MITKNIYNEYNPILQEELKISSVKFEDSRFMTYSQKKK